MAHISGHSLYELPLIRDSPCFPPTSSSVVHCHFLRVVSESFVQFFAICTTTAPLFVGERFVCMAQFSVSKQPFSDEMASKDT